MSLLKPIAAAVTVVGLYAAVGYIGVPNAVRWATSDVLPGLLGGRSGNVSDVHFNPWTWKLSLKNLTVHSMNAVEPPVLQIDSLATGINFASITQLAPIVDFLQVDGLHVQLAPDLVKSNQASADEAAASKPEAASGGLLSGLPAFSLSNVELTNSDVVLINTRNGAMVRVTDINFDMPVLSTLPHAATGTVTPQISLKIDGTPIQALGQVSDDTATLNLNVSNLDAANIAQAASIELPYDVREASVSTQLQLLFHLPKNAPASVSAKGAVEVKNIDVRELNGKPFVRAQSLSANIDSLDLASRQVRVSKVALVRPTVTAQFDSGLGASPSRAAQKEAPAAAAADDDNAWSWALGSAQVSQGTIELTDIGLKPAAKLTISGLNATAQNFSSAAGHTGSFNLSAKLASGSVQTQGKLTLSPLAVTAQAQVQGLQCAPLNAWITPAAGVRIPKGAVRIKANVNYRANNNALTAQGDLGLDNIDVRDAKNRPLASAQKATVELKQFDLTKQQVDVGRVELKSPVVHVRLEPTPNSGTQEAASETASEAKASPWNWSLAAARIANGSVQITDSTIKPAGSLAVQALDVTAQNFSSKPSSVGTYSASGKVAGGAFSSQGKLGLSPLTLQTSTNVQSVQFAPFNAWVKSIAGAQFAQGSADVKGQLQLAQSESLSLSWKGDLAISDLKAKNAQGKTLMTWKKASATNVHVADIDPVRVSVGRLQVTDPVEKVTETTNKVLGILGAIASATGHDNTARRAQKVTQIIDRDIVVDNLIYNDGRFSVQGIGTDSLQTIIVQALNNIFGAKSAAARSSSKSSAPASSADDWVDLK